MSAHRYAGPRHQRPAGPRHAKPTPPGLAHRTVASTGLAAALVAGEGISLAVSAGSASATPASAFAQLRMCESSGNYATNTGNGYYGAYQFDLQTWHGLGYPGLPSQASPATQDQAAQTLFQNRGWEPWPACSAKLGLVDDRTASRSVSRPPLAPVSTPVASPVATPVSAPVTAPVSAPVSAPVVAPVARQLPVVAPASAASASTPSGASSVVAAPTTWDGHYLTTRDISSVRADVKAWQQQMTAAGYPLAVDGQYGPASAAATSAFEAAKGLHVEHPGIVGPQVWTALFAS
jgi:hypothetical protein